MAWRVPIAAVILTAAICTSPAAETALDATNDAEALALVVEEQFGGAVTAAAIEGSAVYMGMGPRLAVLDAKDLTAPRLLGRTAPFAGLVEHMAVARGFVYATGRLGSMLPLTNMDVEPVSEAQLPGLRIVDVRDPRHPVPLGFYGSDAAIGGVAVDGEMAYLAAGAAGLKIVDVRDKVAPTLVGALDDPALLGSATDVVVSDAVAYVIDKLGRRLVVADVSMPSEPHVMGEVEFRETPTTLEVAAPYVLVGTQRFADSGSLTGRVVVVDVSDPRQPNAVSTLYLAPAAAVADIVVAGTRAYVLGDPPYCLSDFVIAIDLLQPTALRQLPSRLSFLSAEGSLALAGHTLAMPGGELGLRLFDVDVFEGDGEMPFHEYGFAGRVVAAARAPDPGFALLANMEYGGLDIAAVGTGPSETEVGHWQGRGPWSPSMNDLAVEGEVAYVAYGQNCRVADAGLATLDVRQPSEPDALGDVDLGVDVVTGGGRRPGHSAAVEIKGHYAFVADEMGWLSVVDVSDSRSLARVGLVDFEALGRPFLELVDVAVVNDHVYVAAWTPEGSWIEVIDVSSPASPRVVNELSPKGEAWSVAADESHLYVADAGYGVQVWDTTDAANPRYVGGNSSMNAISVEVVDRKIYAIGTEPGWPPHRFYPEPAIRFLWVLDAGEPATLPELGRLSLIDARAVSVHNEEVLVASGQAGVFVISAAGTGSEPPAPTPGSTRTPVPTPTLSGGAGPTLTPRPTPTEEGPPVVKVWLLYLPSLTQ